MLVVVDVEADGPIPYKYSMVSFGAVIVEEGLKRTFFGQTCPVSPSWVPEALAVSGVTRKEHEAYPDPGFAIEAFDDWLKEQTYGSRLIFISDNLAFDWQWMNYYFHTYIGRNPFGFSGRRINDLYSGLKQDMKVSNDWKKLRGFAHTHNPVDDAKGNANALLKFKAMGLRGI